MHYAYSTGILRGRSMAAKGGPQAIETLSNGNFLKFFCNAQRFSHFSNDFQNDFKIAHLQEFAVFLRFSKILRFS